MLDSMTMLCMLVRSNTSAKIDVDFMLTRREKEINI